MRESKSLALPLGYAPMWKAGTGGNPDPLLLLGWEMGLEPTTPGTTIRCSNQLSYTHHISTVWKPLDERPGKSLARQKGLEPLAYCLEGSCSIRLSYWREFWMEQVTRIELASPAWKAGALAIVLHPRMGRPRFAATNRQLINNSTNERICQGPKEKFSIKIRAGAYWYRR